MPEKPNILLVMSDQHSAKALGCAGNSIARTPNLDLLSERGVRFTNTYCAAPLCVPSRMAFLTGRFPSDINVNNNKAILDSNIPTFAHSLSIAGYETTLCGRMHFEGNDQHHGFSRRLVGDVSGSLGKTEHLFEEKLPEHTCGQSWQSVRDSGAGDSTDMAYDRTVTRRACEFLQDKKDNFKDDIAPWFMTVGYLLPHNPYICPRDLFDEYMAKVDAPQVRQEELDNLHPAMLQWRERRGIEKITKDQTRRARAAYFGLVTYMDSQIGQILNTLEQTGLDKNTVVIYVSDHGEMAGEHGLWWKDSFYEGSVKVPFICSYPDKYAKGKQINSITSLLDIAPTLIDIAGAEPLPGQRGQSLLSALKNGYCPTDWRDMAMSQIYPNSLWPARMIRRGKWKLNHYHGFNDPQLFNLEEDPGEQNDIGRYSEYSQVRQALLGEVLTDWPGEKIKKQTAQSNKEINLMRQYGSIASMGESEIWHIPEGCNNLEKS